MADTNTEKSIMPTTSDNKTDKNVCHMFDFVSFTNMDFIPIKHDKSVDTSPANNPTINIFSKNLLLFLK